MMKFQKKKIAMIGPTYPFRGGISHYTTLLFRHLKKRNSVRLFAFSRQYPKWLFPGETDKDPSQVPLRETGVEHAIDSINPVTWVKTARKINQWHPDLIIIPWWVSFWAPQFLVMISLIKRESNAKILFICHNVIAHESKAYDRLLTCWVLRKGDMHIVHSVEDKNNLLKMLPGARVSRQYLPTYDAFRFHEIEPEVCRNALGISGAVILFFGFIREYKGLKYLIEAMPLIQVDVPVTLLIVGEFWKDKADYMDMIEKMGIGNRVKIIDRYVSNEDVGLYFCAADLVVQPYVSGTGSAVVQLAFGFHKPVVATMVGSLPEIVEDGKTGFLVPPGDSTAISDAVIRFFKEGCAEDFKENILREQYRFSWDHLVDEIEKMAGVGGGVDLRP